MVNQTPPSPDDSAELMESASQGDSAARHALLERNRERLERMVSFRMDRRIARRVDPADVVQEALVEAWQELPGYLENRPVAFYPWLRRIAWERLVKHHEKHVEAQKRSVRREAVPLPDQSSIALAECLARTQTSPSGRLMRQELREQVRRALTDLGENDREILVLLYLERLSITETAAALEISKGAVKMRHMRALQRLRLQLPPEGSTGGIS